MTVEIGINIDSFMYNKLPNIVRTLLNNKILKLDKKRREDLEKTLNKLYKVSLSELIDIYCNNINVNRNGESTVYDISIEPIKVNGYNLDKIIRFVDYGNLYYRGYNLFNSVLYYILDNIETFYKFSSLEGGY